MFAAQLLTKQGLTVWGAKVTNMRLLPFSLCKLQAQSLTEFTHHLLTVTYVVQHNASIANGELWRLITPTFLHGNIVHLVLNSAALNNLGPLVETVSGRSRFLTVYTVAAIAGVTASYLGSPHPSLGSSG